MSDIYKLVNNKGFEFTGEYRKAKSGEWFLVTGDIGDIGDSMVCRANFETVGKYLIVRTTAGNISHHCQGYRLVLEQDPNDPRLLRAMSCTLTPADVYGAPR